jgi:hypothetical protein
VSATRAAQAVDPDEARRRAEHILSGRRYNHDPAPRPLRGPLEWIGQRLRSVVDWVSSGLSRVPGWLWIAVGLAIVGIIVWRIVVALARRGGTLRVPTGRAGRGSAADESEDPDVLERAADEAERDGDLDRAVRFRFRAGLLRLGDRGAISYRPSVTTSEVRCALGSTTFDELAQTFENVAYGGTAAQPPDVETARREWPRVLDEAAPR